MSIFHLMDKMQLTIDEIEALTGPVSGKPKSATFRTADVVGIDTLVKVAQGVKDNCPHDEARDIFTIPVWLNKMVENKWLGDKSGQGFFKKIKGADGKSEIHTLNLQTFEYAPRVKPKFPSIDAAKAVESLDTRMKMIFMGKDKASDFYRHFHYGLFSYVSFRIPEISDELYRLDDGMKAGFGWEEGPFELWTALGVRKTTEEMKTAGYKVANG